MTKESLAQSAESNQPLSEAVKADPWDKGTDTRQTARRLLGVKLQKIKEGSDLWWIARAVQTAFDRGVDSLWDVTDKCKDSYRRTGAKTKTEKDRRRALDLAARCASWGSVVLARSDVIQEDLEPGLPQALGELGYALRFNKRTGKTEYCEPFWDSDKGEREDLDDVSTSAWIPIGEHFESYLREQIARALTTVSNGKLKPLRWAPDRWRTVLGEHLHQNQVDPFKLWLDRLPPWDGEPRLDSLLGELFGIPDDGGLLTKEIEDRPPEAPDCLLSWASRFLILGPLTRSLEPGYKLDEMLILTGRQHIGKSTFCKWLLPQDIPDLFQENFRFDMDPKQRAEQMRGKAIVEVSEVSGLSHADLEDLKAFLTRTDDEIRLTWRKDPYSLPRTCIFVGTTNNETPLPNDPSGLRRWVVIPVASRYDYSVLTTSIEGDRTQLWAEALSMYRDGQRPFLPAYLKTMQTQLNEDRRQTDPLEDRLLQLGKQDFPASTPQVMSALDIVSWDRRTENRVLKTLRNAGFERRRERVNGKRVYRWHAPENWHERKDEFENEFDDLDDVL